MDNWQWKSKVEHEDDQVRLMCAGKLYSSLQFRKTVVEKVVVVFVEAGSVERRHQKATALAEARRPQSK